MNCSIAITNNSGATQNVAVFLSELNASDYPLVLFCRAINSGGNATFAWDDSSYGLGWGTTPAPIREGMQYTSGVMSPAKVFPNSAGGYNTLPITYQPGFASGSPYCNANLSNKAQIVTDTSFTVPDAATMSVALYMQDLPVLAMQGAPNTDYYFDVSQLSYYLTVTNAKAGMVLPAYFNGTRKFAAQAMISMTPPTLVEFAAGAKDLAYVLDNTLVFTRV